MVDGALPGARDLRMAVERFRRTNPKAPRSAAEGSESGGSSPAGMLLAGEQTHLFVIYQEIVECSRVRHAGVRDAAAEAMQAVGALLPVGSALMNA